MFKFAKKFKTMKKYSFIILFLSLCQIKAQTLTSSSHNPVAGDVFTYKKYDSTATIPKQMGANQTWNFSNCITSTSSPNQYIFVNPSSVPSSSMFPNCNLVIDYLGGDYDFIKTTPNSYELHGSISGTMSVFKLTDPLVTINYPFSMGSLHNDVASGNGTINSLPATISATLNVSGTGTGSVILPGNTTISNILQTIGNGTTVVLINVGFGNATLTVRDKGYYYYSANVKQSIIEVTYSSSTIQVPLSTPTIQNTYKIDVNHNVLTGLNDHNFEATFQIFPNPGSNFFVVNLSNFNNEICTIEIYNSAGVLTKKQNLGRENEINALIDVTDLPVGLYLVKTNLGERQSIRKFIKN